MTEKRFSLSIDTEWWFIQDNTIQVNKHGYRDDLTGEDEYRGLHQELTEQETVDLLNELNDEIQLLHKINEDTINFMYDNFDSNIIFTDRELNDICNEMGWELSEKGIKINRLEKENEQLKQFKEKVLTWIDKEIARNEEAIERGKETGADSNSIGYYNQMLKRLKKELSE